MLKREYPYIDQNGKKHLDLERHYSDANKYIQQDQTGAIYDAAIDVYPCRYTYTETDKVIEMPEEPTLTDI